jgi:hypothetical protein
VVPSIDDASDDVVFVKHNGVHCPFSIYWLIAEAECSSLIASSSSNELLEDAVEEEEGVDVDDADTATIDAPL